MRNLTNDDPLSAWCKSLAQDGDFEQAEGFARILHRDNSTNSLILLVDILSSKGSYQEAINILDNHLAQNSAAPVEELSTILITKAIILAESGHNHPALKLLEKVQNLCLDDQNVLEKLNVDYKLGSLYVKLKEFEAAQRIFDKPFSFEFGEGLEAQSNIFHLVPADKKTTKKPLRHNNPYKKTLIKQKTKSASKCVYYVCGSLDTCRRFAPAIARQLNALSGNNVHFHIHGVITGDDDPGNSSTGWDSLRQLLEKIDFPLTLTLQNFDIDDLDEAQQKAIFEIERFRYLPELLETHALPVIASDIAQLPLYDPSVLTEDDFDVALQSDRGSALDLLSEISTAIAIFNMTPDALEFAAELKAYFTHAMSEPQKLNEGLVQAGLAVTKYKSSSVILSKIPTDLVEYNSDLHHPFKAYDGSASFIAKGAEQDDVDFSSFLTKYKNDFSPPMLARAMGNAGQMQQAIRLLERALAKRKKLTVAEKFELLQIKGLMHAHTGELELSHKALEKSLTFLESGKAYDHARKQALYKLASCKAALGDFKGAEKIFDQKIPVYCGNGWVTHTGIIDLLSEKIDSEDFDLTTLSQTYDSATVEHVYLVAADLKYCQMFIPTLIAQLKSLNLQGLHLHVHGISTDKDISQSADVKAWQELKDSLINSNLSVTLTLNSVDFDGLNLQQRKSVYASERFRILPKLLKQYDTPILVADVDQLPLQDIGRLLKKDCDVQIMRIPMGVLNFLSYVSATISIYYPTPAGLEVASALKSYFDRAYVQPERLDWHIDQAALAVADYKQSAAKFGYLHTDIVAKNPKLVTPDEALNDGAYFWSVTNSISGNSNALAHFENQNNTPVC